MPKKKEWTIPYLRNKIVWPLCSKYVRLKFADWRGYEKCCTCDLVKHYKEMQAGHFTPGRTNAILFDLRGIHPQCYGCNIRMHGNPRKYQAFMLRTYGQDVIDDLDRLSDTSKSFTREELMALKADFEAKIAALPVPADPL